MKATVRNGRAMGSPLRVSIPALDARAADAAWVITARTFDEAERVLSRFDPDSALSRLNRAVGTEQPIPRSLARALVAAWRAFRITSGRFDPRIIGALEAAGERAGVPLPASPRCLDPADRWLRQDARRGVARISAPIDLGGIGKGLALRWTARNLRRAGIGDFLVSAGGDIVADGVGPAGRPWTVRLEDAASSGPPVTIELPGGGAVATSSIAVRSWVGEDGAWKHHLIDPATLRPATVRWRSVTVAAPDPAWAEVLSKVGFLAGDRIGSVLAGHRAWWVPHGEGPSTGRRSRGRTTLGPVAPGWPDGR